MLTLVEGERHLALIKVSASKTRVRAILKYIGEEGAHVYDCRLREGEDVTPLCFSKLARELDEKYPGTGEGVAEALVKAVKEWEALLEYAEIKDVEEMVKAGVQPILELETERGIVRVLSSDGAVLDVHGGFLNLGDCVVVAESTFAYTELVGGEESYEKPNVVGLAVAYCCNEGALKLKETRWFLPLQTRLSLAGRLVRLKSSEKATLTYHTFADIETLKAVADGRSLDADWRAVGERIINKLKDYVVFSDERLYSVVASYIVMTYFHDFLTAVPFLYFYGPPGSGKTRANLTATYMCRRGVFVADPSEATLYRLVEAAGPTLGIDESALSERAKRILAAGYKKGAVVPRAEPTKSGVVLKLFEATAPRIFSFTELPQEDYLLQRIIPINMVRSRPRREQDPSPVEFKEIREKLYYLRLTRVPEILNTMKRAFEELKQKDVWGRELEIWAPVYTAAILIGRDQEVLSYIMEDVARRRESELMYAEEKLVLYAIDQLFTETPEPLVGAEKICEFTASDLQEKIINKLLEELNCIEVVQDMGVEYKRAKSDAKCQKILADLVRTWSPPRIGKVLEKLGFDKYKKSVRKGGSVRKKYVVKWSDFAKIAKAYDYEPQSQGEEKKNEQ
jgi:RecA/RadA recombinase